MDRQSDGDGGSGSQADCVDDDADVVDGEKGICTEYLGGEVADGAGAAAMPGAAAIAADDDATTGATTTPLASVHVGQPSALWRKAVAAV